MLPELGQAVVAKTDGEGPAVAIVEVNSARAAGPVGIELDSILREGNPVTTTCINFPVVWPPFGAAELVRIGFKAHLGK